MAMTIVELHPGSRVVSTLTSTRTLLRHWIHSVDSSAPVLRRRCRRLQGAAVLAGELRPGRQGGCRGHRFLWGRTRPVPPPEGSRGGRGSNRPNRQARRSHGKSDPLDAVEAARAVISGRAVGAGKTKDGAVEAIRVLMVAKRSARQARVKAIVQMRHLVITAPDQLHSRLKGLTVTVLVAESAKLRAIRAADPVTAATKASLCSLAHRVQSSGGRARRTQRTDRVAAPCHRSCVDGPVRRRTRYCRSPSGCGWRQPRTPSL